MRKTFIILTSCLVLLLVGYTGYRSYLVWRESHGITLAKGFISRGDIRNGMLSLQQVLKSNPRNIEACRMMANVLEVAHSSSALAWRQKVLELAPGSFEDRMALAQAAIMTHDYALATNTLAGVAEANRNTAVYHSMAGTAALVMGQPDLAEQHFKESVRLAPSDPFPEMNLAVVRLHRTNTLDIAEARISLQRIIMTTTNAALGNQARRELISDAMRFKDYPTARTVAKELIMQPYSVFADKLLHLDVLEKSQSPDFKPAFALYEAEASTNLIEISDLGKWQMANLSVTTALDWLRQLPAQMRTNQTVEVLIANCLLQKGDWRGLQATIEPENWGDHANPIYINLEFMRHAYLARALYGQGLTEGSSAEWTVAVKAATDQKYTVAQKVSFKTLFELAVKWNWNTEAEQVLWTVVNQFPEEKWAFPTLKQALYVWHRTKSLMQLLDIMAKRSPDDYDIKNDLATVAMLLGAQEMKPHDLARQVYEKDPKNSDYAATYAFALYQQGKYADALKIMKQLSPEQLQDPAIAGYYALILKATGNNAEAKTYLSRTAKATLLPEEQALFEKAAVGL
jgi:Flp pilus assembly protein TadD